MPGNGCKPITEANGENGIYMPISKIAIWCGFSAFFGLKAAAVPETWYRVWYTYGSSRTAKYTESRADDIY